MKRHIGLNRFLFAAVAIILLLTASSCSESKSNLRLHLTDSSSVIVDKMSECMSLKDILSDLSGTDLFLKLETDGLVENILNRGAFVVGMTEQDYEDMFELRKVYEIQAVKWAIERITESEMDKLAETFEFMEFYTMRNDIDKMLTINTGFHQVIYEASHNKMLKKLLSSYQNFLKYKGAESVYDEDYLPTVLEEHRAIYDAFKAGDAKAGAKAMEIHINRARDRRCGK